MSDALYPTFARAPLSFERGEGARLFTAGGDAYLDFTAGIAVNSLGHCHPHLVEALKGQAEKVWHVSNLFEIPGQSRLAERLVEATFADRVFFANSGAEALECAIKTARRYHYVEGAPERYGIITFEGAFHGRTMATIAAGGQAKYLEGFGPKLDGFDQVPFGDLKAVREAVGPQTAAILIEPIQGEGGLRPAETGFLKGLRQLCDEHGLLLVFDEVQCGVGRTGKLFAYEWSGVEPDIMAVAKGIGGGFPLGACLATEEAGEGHDARHARHDLRRQPARHGGRQRGARRHPGAGLPAARAGHRAAAAPGARPHRRQPSRRHRGGARHRADARPQEPRRQQGPRLGAARRAHADGRRRRQRRAAPAAADHRARPKWTRRSTSSTAPARPSRPPPVRKVLHDERHAPSLRGPDGDFARATCGAIIESSRAMKAEGRNAARPLEGRTLAMIFDKPSTRTRVSFDVGMRQLGGEAIFLTGKEMQLGRGETIADTARVLSRFVDAIMIRLLEHEDVQELARHASVPVINGLTRLSHPCQIMADVMTFEEHRGPIAGRTVTWTGDCNNVTASWIHAAARFDFKLRIAAPKKLRPRRDLMDWIEREKVKVSLHDDPFEAVDGADCVVTDTWVSMGDEGAERRHNLLKPYQVNERLMKAASPDAIFMHCLPAHRGEEVTDEVMDGPQSVVFDEAENRLHAQKGILAWCLEGRA